MSALAERVALATQNLGSAASLDYLASAIAAITAELEQSPQACGFNDLAELRTSLDFTSAVLARLRYAVRSQIGAIAGENLDAG